MKYQTIQNSHKPIEKLINKIICGDALSALKTIPDESIDCVVTSPPYWALRDYNVAGQIGLESNIKEYLEKLLCVFDEIHRVLKPAGTCWVNLGDTYGGSGSVGRMLKANQFPSRELSFGEKRYAKSLLQIPARFAVSMIERGWLLRNEIIWHKPNCLPQSVKDRLTVNFEKIFFFVKNRRYYFNQQFEPVKDRERLKRRYHNPDKQHKWSNADKSLPINAEALEKSRQRVLKRGRNLRCVWRIGTTSFPGNHFAVYPEKLVETPILAGCPAGGIVLDPFIGSGTTAVVARKLGRKYIGIELNSEYVRLAENRLIHT